MLKAVGVIARRSVSGALAGLSGVGAMYALIAAMDFFEDDQYNWDLDDVIVAGLAAGTGAAVYNVGAVIDERLFG